MLFFSLLLLLACSNEQPSNKSNSPSLNFNHAMQSFSNYEEVTCKHLDWNAKIDFSKKIISGTATWKFENKAKAKTIRFDNHALAIKQVQVNGRRTNFNIGTAFEKFGEGLEIPIQEGDSVVAIQYETSPNATAIQWLEPSQTAGKKLPYLFTQCESIHARSLLPCQDVPAIRITYNAQIQTPQGMMAVMSARNPQEKDPSGKYSFTMEIPIPSYLIALAVGDISYKAINERSGVYTEPSMLDKATQELSDIPTMMKAAEELGGPYRWGHYDVLIAPPSFPIGGMENPRLTFATPTIIAGDKSLVTLIAHEMAHSWSGNLVTNATWNDLWLNEGFTTYFERRIMEKVAGKTYNDMLWELGYQDLLSDLKDFGDTSADTKLRIEIGDRHPEDAFTNIPYEKGAVFLRLVEETVGREKFDLFLNNYFQSHAFQPMTTDKCLAYMDEHLFKEHPDWKSKINVQKWVFGSGLPDNCPHTFPERFQQVEEKLNGMKQVNMLTEMDTKTWTPHEWLHFLRGLPHPSSPSVLEKLDATFHLTQTTNAEIAMEWYRLGISSGYDVILPKLDAFLSSVGRKKFLVPLYTEMIASTKYKKLALDIFKKYQNNYHPQTASKLRSIWSE